MTRSQWGVHPRCLRCGLDGAEVVRVEDGVELLAVLGVAVAEQEAPEFHARSEVCGEVRACCVVQACVGWVVTPVMCRRLVPWSRNARA